MGRPELPPVITSIFPTSVLVIAIVIGVCGDYFRLKAAGFSRHFTHPPEVEPWSLARNTMKPLGPAIDAILTLAASGVAVLDQVLVNHRIKQAERPLECGFHFAERPVGCNSDVIHGEIGFVRDSASLSCL
jgi:hypothetical protein